MIGNMRRQMKLQEQIRTLDEGGGFVFIWEDVATRPAVFAAIKQLSGGESFQHHQTGFSATHKITIRYRSDITPDMRLTEGDSTYDILSIMDIDGRKNYLEITASLRFQA
jgi:SPP1 family predicted phage head-tail adaptor